MHEIIETHCHLDYLKEKPLEDILQAARDNGVQKIITIAVEPDNFDAVFKLSQENEMIYCSQGIHPHDAKLCTDDALKIIEQRQTESKVVAVGEIGLDYYYENSPREIQKTVFIQQLEIAIKTKKPVVIHSRDADGDMIEILSAYAPKMENKGVIHSFTAGEELAKKALELGFNLGFNGIITFKKAQNVRDIVKLCPIDRILLETDAPFLTPVPHRGKENTPEYLPHILEKVAEIKEISIEVLAKQCKLNSEKTFKF